MKINCIKLSVQSYLVVNCVMTENEMISLHQLRKMKINKSEIKSTIEANEARLNE